MSIDFATLKGLAIPEGVVTKIADAAGRVLWELVTSKPVVLEVEKITSDTYAGETTYTGEEFILLDIYPKSGGTVNVTYGGLTKTITDTSGAEDPNAQQVYFGTFNGVSDSLVTPASGTLTIEGSFTAFGVGSFSTSSKGSSRCGCITNVVEWGNTAEIPSNAFNACASLALNSLPESVTKIGGSAFSGCTSLALISLPDGVTDIGTYAFYGCTNLALAALPTNIKSIGGYAFYSCKNINVSIFPEGLLEIGDFAFEQPNSSSTMPMYNGTITLPSTLQTLGRGAFRGRLDYESYKRYLKTVRVMAVTPPSISETSSTDGVFGQLDIGELSIVVPAGCGDAYKAAEGWSGYSSYIVEAS